MGCYTDICDTKASEGINVHYVCVYINTTDQASLQQEHW